jgi:hypothetical protein
MGRQNTQQTCFITNSVVIVLWIIVYLLLPNMSLAWSGETRKQFTNDCRQMVKQYEMDATEQQQYAYCTCLYNYHKQYLKYSDYKEIDALVREGQLKSIAAKFPSYPRFFEQGNLLCARRYVPSVQTSGQ